MSQEWLKETESGGLRCGWCGDDAAYIAYHDTEWGRPVFDDQRLYEKLCLEGFQSGLSWLTILRKRENFRAAFQHFDIEQVARFTDDDVKRLMADAGIVRHRGKIEATISNAQRALELLDETGSIASFIWKFASHLPYGREIESRTIASTSNASIALSKDLKKRGWKFVGPTTVYSFMQSMGLVNDHFEQCHSREECEVQRLDLLAKLRM